MSGIEKRWSMRLRTLVAGTAMVLSLSSLAQAADVTTIKVLNWQPGGPEYWAALVEAFEAEHPDIKVELETVPFDHYPDVQGPYIATCSGPDVMEQNAGLELFDRRVAYQELPTEVLAAGEDLLTRSGGCLNYDLSQACYGLPFGLQGNVMYYNKEVLTEAGLYPENPPATWEEFGDACEKINAMSKTCLALGMTGVFPKSSALGQIREIIKTPTIHVGVLLSGQEVHALGRGWQEVALGRLTVEDWVTRMQTALEESPGKN